MVQLLGKITHWFSPKLKIESPYVPEALLLCVYPKELKVGSAKAMCTLLFTTGLFTIVKSNPSVHLERNK